MKDFFLPLTGAIIIVSIIIAAIYGWIFNILDIFYHFDAMSTGEAVIRIIGIFIVFIGAVVGYL